MHQVLPSEDDTARMKLITGYIELHGENIHVSESFHLAYKGEDVLIAVTNNLSKVWQDIKLRDILYMHVSRRSKASYVFDPGGAACNDEISSAWDSVQAKQENKRRCYFYGICSSHSISFWQARLFVSFGDRGRRKSTRQLGALIGVRV